MHDVIGDVHGQGGKLKALLARLGYVERAGRWPAPQGRQAVFVGDLIDRGPDQLEVLCWRRCKSASIRWRSGGFALSGPR